MTTSIDDAIREYNALALAQKNSLGLSIRGVQNAVQNLSMSFPIGTRVLDLVTGEEGVVFDGKRENVIIPSA